MAVLINNSNKYSHGFHLTKDKIMTFYSDETLARAKELNTTPSILAFTDQMRSVRDANFKLILYPQVNFTQLFDLESDPSELNNLADDPEQQERIARMTELLKGWQTQLGDTQVLTVENPAQLEVDLTGFEREPDRWQPEWIVEKYFGN